MPVNLAQVAVPGTLILPVYDVHATAIVPVLAAALGNEMSLFAATIQAQDYMSVGSMEIKNILNKSPFPKTIGSWPFCRMTTPMTTTVRQLLEMRCLRIVLFHDSMVMGPTHLR
jgi:hypothetical protein